MRKKTVALAKEPVPLTCGVCRFFQESKRAGTTLCHAMPPQVLVDPDGDLASARPPVREEDLACHLHQPRLNS